MGFTLRQLQKMLHQSKQPGAPAVSSAGLGTFGQVLHGDDQEWGHAELHRGCIVDTCTCLACRVRGQRKTADITSLIDSLCHRYGHKADAMTALKSELRGQPRQPKPAPPQTGAQDAGDQQAGEPQAGEQQADAGSPPQPAPLTPEDMRAIREWQRESEEAAKQADAAEKAQQQQEQKRQQAQRKNAAAVRAARKSLSAARGRGAKAARTAKAALRQAKAASAEMAMPGMPTLCGPSRMAKRQIADATARLRRVSPKLRRQLAEVINRLVATSGTAGEELSTVPMIDSRKLVKRMLVRRPLANALKEDVQRGRPVTLFLPDISPSCSAQAQDACDLANAAGYAGVAGSDVLVLPHSNGCVEGGDAYTPWFNGKPAPMSKTQFAEVLDQVVRGTSKYRVRVVVAIGDHDAEEMYHEVARLRQVTKLIWLHNDTMDGSSKAVRARSSYRPDWDAAWLEKLHLIYGCVDQVQMLSGLNLAIT